MGKYRPSNGTEGMSFVDRYCANCVHGKYEHTGNLKDKPCEILTRSFCYDANDDEYPEEWKYVDGKPTCTARIPWEWKQDDDGNWIDYIPPDPNQLKLF